MKNERECVGQTKKRRAESNKQYEAVGPYKEMNLPSWQLKLLRQLEGSSASGRLWLFQHRTGLAGPPAGLHTHVYITCHIVTSAPAAGHDDACVSAHQLIWPPVMDDITYNINTTTRYLELQL